MKRAELLFTLGRIGSDFIATFVALMAAYWLRIYQYDWFGLSVPNITFTVTEFIHVALYIACGMVVLFALQSRYNIDADKKTSTEIVHTLWGVSAGIALLLIGFYFTRITFFSRFIIGIAWMGTIISITLGRIILRGIRQWLYQYNIGRKTTIIIGTGKLAQQLIEILHTQRAYNILGIVSIDMEGVANCQGHPVIGTVNQYETLLQQYKPHQVVLASDRFSEDTTAHLSRIAHRRHAEFRYIPNEVGLDLSSVKVETLSTLPVVTLLASRMTSWGSFWKFIFDKCVATIALIILSPVLIVVAFLVKREHPEAPIFIGIKRVGQNGKLFPCYKFRSMVPNAHTMRADLFETSNEREGGVLFKMKKDPRVTKLGHILRKTSLDELPQLWNVLRNEMSLIGPRPHLPEEVQKYPLDDLRILALKPGITGYAQLHGRGDDLPFDEEIKYEVYYMQQWSLWFDSVILWKTIWMIIGSKMKSN